MRNRIVARTLMGAGLALSLLSAAACGPAGGGSGQETAGGAAPTSAPTSGSAPATEPTAAQPDLSDVPDVVATVNGQEITKEQFTTAYEGQFQQMSMQAQMSGQPVDQDQLKQQTVENMIGTELLIQESGDRGFTATPEQVNATLEEIAAANQLGSADEVKQALAEQGMTEDEILSQVETQVKIDQLVAEEAGDTAPTEEELRALYDQLVAQQEQSGAQGGQSGELPSFEDLRPQLEQQATAQKEGEAVQALVTELREGAEVTVNL